MKKQPCFGERCKRRFQILNCWIQLKPKGIPGYTREKYHNLSLIDLSTSGLQAVSDKALKNKRGYDIAILAPAFREPLWAEGRMVWSKPYTADDNKQYYRVGLKFTCFKCHAKNKIEHLEWNPCLREITEHSR